MSDPQECPIREEDIASPGSDIATYLVCLGNGVNEGEILNQQMEAVRNTEGNPNTHVPGVYLHSVPYQQRSLQLVRVELSEYPETTIGELASALQTERNLVVEYILRWHQGPNRHIIDYLYARYINGNASERTDKIVALRDVRNGSSQENIPHSRHWTLPRRQNRRLLLPRSPAFQESVISHRAALVTRDVTNSIDRLNQALDVVLEVARNLGTISRRCGQLLTPYNQEAGMIDMMENFLEIAQQYASTSIDTNGYTTLKRKVSELKDQAHDKFSSSPTTRISRDRRRITELTNSLYHHLQNADSELNQALAAIIAQENAVLPSYINEACQKLSGCYQALAKSIRGEDFVRNDLNPLLDFLANQNSGQTPQEVFEQFPCGIGAAAAWLPYFPTIAGNLPGPPSVLLVAIEASISITIKVGAGDRAFALLFQQGAATTLARILGVGDDNLELFTRKLTTADADELMTFRASLARQSTNIVDSQVMQSQGWGIFMSAVTGFLFLNAICSAAQSNEQSIAMRIRLIADVVSTGSNFLLSLQIVLKYQQRLAVLQQVGSSTRLANGLGLVAAIAATISSGAVAVDEYQTQDYTGMLVAGVGVVSGVLAVVGWLIIIFASTSWTGVGAVLLVLSFIVGIAAMLIGWLLGDSDGDALFEGLVQNLKDAEKFSQFRTGNNAHGRALNAKFLAVEAYHHDVAIEDVTEAARDALEALFGLEQINDSEHRQSAQDIIDSLIA